MNCNYKKITSDDVKAYLDKQPWEVHEEYDTTYLDFTYRDGIECKFTKSFAAPERFTRGTEAFTEAAMEHYGYTQDEWYALDDAKFLDLERDYETGACADEFLDWAYELLDSDDYEEACEELAEEVNAWYAENGITPDD